MKFRVFYSQRTIVNCDLRLGDIVKNAFLIFYFFILGGDGIMV